ncbi:MAG: PEGA domain-containing protein [Opitutales bacterium]
MNPRWLILSACAVGSLFLVGCSFFETWNRTFEEGVPQTVVIQSFPDGAQVLIDGEDFGHTPVRVALPRKQVHEVRLRHPGYRTSVKYFAPKRNEKGEAFVRFGLMEDLGYYYDLTPRAMRARLSHSLVPRSKTGDPFREMASRVLEADNMLVRGEIDPLEHRWLTHQLREFYLE